MTTDVGLPHARPAGMTEWRTMSEEFLKDPLSLFSVKGKTAIVTGATGAFGAMAAKIAGRRRRQCRDLRPTTRTALKKVAAECAKLGGKAEIVAKRPSSEANCDGDRQGRGRCVRQRRHPRGRVGPEQGVEDRRPEAGGFPRRDGRQRHAVLADGARRRPADAQAGQRRQGHPDVVGARPARPSRRLHRLLRVEVGDRRHHQGARLRAGAAPASPSMRWGRRCSARRSPNGCSPTTSAARPCAPGFLTRVPKGRLGEPSDLAGPLLFLASQASDFYTGHILYADGGYTAG